MASNSFGQIFRITTWGESHGPAIGVVIDGCPAGIDLEVSDIMPLMRQRSPGQSGATSPRKELDEVHIYSGVFEGKTTGTPISIVIFNHDVDSSKYEPIKHILRPGHAQYTYLQKYGIYDHRGGGRASARETACRVAAGAVAKKLLEKTGIRVHAYLAQVGDLQAQTFDLSYLKQSKIACADEHFEQQVLELIEQKKQVGDSIGGMVGFEISNVLPGLGDPVYEKIEANLAKAMLSLPASKGFEIGDGFKMACLSGSTANDCFSLESNLMASNHAGGTLAGISSGMPIYGKVVFKPTSSIMLAQQTLDLEGNPASFQLPKGSRHDPCVAIRAVPVVAAMCYLVLADAYLMNLTVRVDD